MPQKSQLSSSLSFPQPLRAASDSGQSKCSYVHNKLQGLTFVKDPKNERINNPKISQADGQTDSETVIQTVTQPQISTIHGKNEVILSTAIGVLHHQLSGPLHSSSHLQTVR